MWARAQYEARIALMAAPAEIAGVREQTIDGPGGPLRIRIYTLEPLGPQSAAFLKKHNYLIPRAVSVRSDLLKTSASEPAANSSNQLRNCAVVLL
jgi:hypothetical protein